MNYRHSYHAGCFADVLKHVILIELIKSLKQKDKPFFYLDTHAGRGLYDLASAAALKTQEADFGIKRLLELNKRKIPEVLKDYMATIKACQHTETEYPGSPLIVRELMRPDDRMFLTELHPEEFALLKDLFSRDSQVVVQHQDAYQGLKALLPPTPRRGLVLIDPAFEVTDEFERIIKGLKEALSRWQNGIYAIWYPIKDKANVSNFKRKIKNLNLPYVNISLQIFGDEEEGLTKTGVVIINPPYQFEAIMKKIMPELSRLLADNGAGEYKIESFE